MVYIGTSGWSYKDWGKCFYPPHLPPGRQLSFLAQHFPTVEINASFYRLPAVSTFVKWHDDTPEHFKFAVKVSRFITHIKRLYQVKDSWQLLRERSQPLGQKLGVYLMQFPPSFAASEENCRRLEAFLAYAAGPDVRLAFELRHRSWFEPDALALFRRHGLCMVQAESSRYPHTPAGFAPAGFTYYRFHGPRQLYASQYTDAELTHWASLIRQDLEAGKDVYGYFDNDVNGYALEDARRLSQKLLA